jgi:hypothetical protein
VALIAIPVHVQIAAPVLAVRTASDLQIAAHRDGLVVSHPMFRDLVESEARRRGL